MNIKTIKNVSIIGIGTQGAQIAFRNAIHDKVVSVYDIHDNNARKARVKIKDWIRQYREDGRINVKETEQILKNIKYHSDIKECLAKTDLIIESIPEVLEKKQQVWEKIDRLAPKEGLLTTNSSSLKSSTIGENVARKEKTFNLNFMTPVKDDLVEVMWNEYTSEGTKRNVMEYLISLKLVPIVTHKEIKGFSHNRVWRAIKKEALKLWDQGYCDYEDLDRAFILEFGTKYGPFGLMDIVGLDVVRDIEISYYNDSKDETDKPPEKLLRLIEEGYLGVKTSKGFYEYPEPKYLKSTWLYRRDY